MNTELALRAIEAMEPYARRFMEKVERDPGYCDRYFLAWQQALLILAAYDTPENPPNNSNSSVSAAVEKDVEDYLRSRKTREEFYHDISERLSVSDSLAKRVAYQLVRNGIESFDDLVDTVQDKGLDYIRSGRNIGEKSIKLISDWLQSYGYDTPEFGEYRGLTTVAADRKKRGG